MSKKDNLNSFLKKNNKELKSKNKIDYYNFLSTASQVGTLIVVVFGYFYTVKPVFQYQLLEEKNAQTELKQEQLEEELSSIERDLGARRSELARVALRNEELERSIGSYEEEVSSLLSVRNNLEGEIEAAYLNLQKEQDRSNELLYEVENAESRVKEANERVEEIQREVESELSALENARWELILTDLTIITLVGGGEFGYFRSSEEGDELEFSDMLNNISASWPNLFLLLMSAIDELEEKNRIENKYPGSYIEELRRLARVNRGLLICERPDFNKIENDYKRDSEEIVRLAEIETRQEMDRIRSENTRPVIFAEGYFERLVRLKIVEKEIMLDYDYGVVIREMWSDCSDRVYEFYDFVSNEKNID